MPLKMKPPSRLKNGRLEEVKPASIAARRPDLLMIWDPEENRDRGLDPFEVTDKDDRSAVWICPECGRRWEQMICNRVSSPMLLCPKCGHYHTGGKRRNLRQCSEALFEEYNSLRNSDDPDRIFAGQRFPVYWWKCRDCGFEWRASVEDRMKGKNPDGTYRIKPCPCCGWSGKGRPLAAVYPGVERIFSAQNGRSVWELRDTYSRPLYWDCPHCGRTFRMETRVFCKRLVAGTLGETCPHDGFILGPEGTLFGRYPELEAEFGRENILLFDPLKTSWESKRMAMWICPDCGDRYPMTISKRVEFVERGLGNPCRRCRGFRVKTPHYF